MAAMHWALMVLGDSQQEANRIVTAFNLATCVSCKSGGSVHTSIPSTAYAVRFCVRAQQIPGRDSLHRVVDVGDVLITSRPTDPMHTMIVRKKGGPEYVTVRGFNNQGTLGTGGDRVYDPQSRNIAVDDYWKDDRFGLYGTALYVVAHDDFMAAARRLRMTFSAFGGLSHGSRWS